MESIIPYSVTIVKGKIGEQDVWNISFTMKGCKLMSNYVYIIHLWMDENTAL
jgi:hypothetical protein